MKIRRTKSVGALTKGFGYRLKTLRQERGLSQKQLADMVGANVMQICRYERGQVLPALETAVALADALKVSADRLLMDRSDDAPPQPTISDLRLFQRFLDAEKLPRDDRNAIILLIDGVIAQRSIEAQLERRRHA